MMKYIITVLLVCAVSLRLHAKNSSDSYVNINNSDYLTLNNLQNQFLNFNKPLLFFPSFTPKNLDKFQKNTEKYLVSTKSENIFIEPEIYIHDYMLLNKNAKNFSKKDLTKRNSIFPSANSSLLSEKRQAAMPDHSLKISQLWDSFRDDDLGQHFAVGCKIWGGVGLGMMLTLMAAPRSVTKWQGDYIQDAFSNLERAYTAPPVWDNDIWQLNYAGHPYAGGLYYNTIRAHGGTPFQSLLFSVFISTTWEYVLEATAEQPSIQDLFVTPLAGSAIGELSHQATLKMQKNGYNFIEKVVVTLINPLYIVINGFH